MAPAGSRAPTMRTPVAGDPVTALPWPAARLGGRGSGGGAPRGPKAALLKGVGLDNGNYAGKNTGVGCHVLLQGIFPIQGSNPGLPHCRQILYYLSHQEGEIESLGLTS